MPVAPVRYGTETSVFLIHHEEDGTLDGNETTVASVTRESQIL